MPQSIRPSTAARAAVFAPLAGGGRAELVTQRLIDAIELGLLSRGEKLPSEAEMARRFGVATVTAREALESLRTLGLVETRRGRDGGSFVCQGARSRSGLQVRVDALSRVELRDMAAYYTAIAAMAAELAADRATPDDLVHLRELVAGTDRSDESAALRGEAAFRLEIAALSQSARLVREELRLQAEFVPLLWLSLREQKQRDHSGEAHLAVVDAIERFDGALARERTARHIMDSVEWLLEAKG